MTSQEHNPLGMTLILDEAPRALYSCVIKSRLLRTLYLDMWLILEASKRLSGKLEEGGNEPMII